MDNVHASPVDRASRHPLFHRAWTATPEPDDLRFGNPGVTLRLREAKSYLDGFYLEDWRPKSCFLQFGHVQTLWGSQYFQEVIRILTVDCLFYLVWLLFTLLPVPRKSAELWLDFLLRYTSGRLWSRWCMRRRKWIALDDSWIVIDFGLHPCDDGVQLMMDPSKDELRETRHRLKFEWIYRCLPAIASSGSQHLKATPLRRISSDSNLLSTEDEQRPILVVIHGLENTTRYPQAVSLAHAGYEAGFDVIAVNCRGCYDWDDSEGIAKFFTAPDEQESIISGEYHGGFTDDINFVTHVIQMRRPGARIYLAGYSLGGITVCKFLGQLGDMSDRRGISGAMVVCLPFDENDNSIDKTLVNRILYAPLLLFTLKMKAIRRLLFSGRRTRMPCLICKKRAADINLKELKSNVQHTEDALRKHLSGEFHEECRYEAIKEILTADTLVDFLRNYTMPLWGYSSIDDFFKDNRAVEYFRNIRVPLLIINSEDDPFFSTDYNQRAKHEMFFRVAIDKDDRVMTPEECFRSSPATGDGKIGENLVALPVRLEVTAVGGHCGFIERPFDHIWQSWMSRSAGTFLAYLEERYRVEQLD